MTIKVLPQELWITNICKKDLSISDLRISIKYGQSLNLLARNKKGLLRYNYSEKHLTASLESGSLFKYKEQGFIKIRNKSPVYLNSRLDASVKFLDKATTRDYRTIIPIEEESFPDLDAAIDDESMEDFAAENADLFFADKAPILAVDPKFKGNSSKKDG